MTQPTDPGQALPSPTPLNYASGPTLNYALWGDRVLAALIDGAINMAVAMVVLLFVYLIGFLLAFLGAGIGAATDTHGRSEPNPVAALITTGGCFVCICGP